MMTAVPRTKVIVPLASAVVIGLAGALIDWPLFLRAWLTAALTCLALPLGALAIVMTHGLTGGRWGDQTLSIWRALIATLPLPLMAMLPLLFGLNELFSWTAPLETLPEVVRNKRLYLNSPFFIGRTLFYFVVWLGLAAALFRSSPKALHGPGLLVWLLSFTFFSVDWLMSLEPTFYSDVFALILATSAIGATLAVAVLIGAWRGISSSMGDLIKLWLVVVVGWAFLAFSQYIIIWHGNLPHEIGWYVHRSDDCWRTLSWVSFFLFCAGPLLALCALSPGLRASRSGRGRVLLTLAACTSLVGFVLRIQWLVLPAFPDQGLALYGFTWLATIVLGAAQAGIALPLLKTLELRHD